MMRLFGIFAVSAALVACDVATASAGCLYGRKSLGGSINGGQSDYGRFYTSSGGSITMGVYAHNGPLRVFMPGCGWNYGNSHRCQQNAGYGEEVHPIIENPNGYTVTYTFTCEG